MYSYNFSEDTYGQGLGAGSTGTSKGDGSDPLDGIGPNPLISLSTDAVTAAPILNYVVGSPANRQPLTYITPDHVNGSLAFIPYNVPVGRINQWTLSVEHQFAKDFAASIAYVGSHGENLQFPTDINQITDPAALAVGINGDNQSLRPFPLFGNITGNRYDGISNYNSLQTTLQKRFSNGLTFQANYVWSHFLDDQDSAGWGSRGGDQRRQNSQDPKANYGNSNFDIPHALKGYASYELPFGQGKTYLHEGNIANAIAGGWRISGTFIHQSGNPFTVYNSQTNALHTQCSGCVWYLDPVSDPNANIPPISQQGIAYFNPAAFVTPQQATFGTVGRNTLRGPRLTVVNLSLAKDFKFGERFGLQLRADFVNALNHPSFQPPNGDISSGSKFGVITPDETAGGTTVAPRSGQLSARFSF
jgi:hypothetical protein